LLRSGSSPVSTTDLSVLHLRRRRRWRSPPPGRTTSCARSSAASTPPRRPARAEPHEFSKPSGYLGSWEPAGEPREAWAQLDRLRKGYARDVRQLRREYAYEVQLMEAERQRKAEARAEAARVANEERKAAKAAAAQTRAAERRAFEEDFRQALVRFLSPSPSLPARDCTQLA